MVIKETPVSAVLLSDEIIKKLESIEDRLRNIEEIVRMKNKPISITWKEEDLIDNIRSARTD